MQCEFFWKLLLCFNRLQIQRIYIVSPSQNKSIQQHTYTPSTAQIKSLEDHGGWVDYKLPEYFLIPPSFGSETRIIAKICAPLLPHDFRCGMVSFSVLEFFSNCPIF